MIPLIKIRLTYLKRKKCVLIFSYLIIPIIIAISSIIYLIVNKSTNKSNINPKQTFDLNFDFNDQLFTDDDETFYQYLKYSYFENAAIVSNDNKTGNDFKTYLENKFPGVNLKLFQDEKSIDKQSVYIIKIDYNEINKSYKFSFLQNKGAVIENENGEPIPSYYFTYPFTLVSTDKIEDVFKYKAVVPADLQDYETNKNVIKTFVQSIISGTPGPGDAELDFSANDFKGKPYLDYLLYQSLICRFLIKQEKGINLINPTDKNVHFHYGYNSFPEAIDNPDDYSILGIVFSYVIDFQYTLTFLSFCVQMIEEKELKLQKLLERQGIGEIKYILSWFINYLLVGLLADIVIIFAMYVFMNSLQGLIIVNIIFYVLAQFPLIYLIYVISSSKKKGIIITNIIAFSTLVVGFVIQEGGPHYSLQMFFNIFPNINEFNMLTIIFKMEEIGVYSSDIVKLRYKQINYIDNLIMFIVEFFMYSLIALFIRSFQLSGLPFLDFIKSIFTKVNREIRVENIEILDKNENNVKVYHEELSPINNNLKNNNLYLNIKNITKIYGELKAVNNFSGEIFKNEIFCLLGHNGAGKSTLIKMISGTEDPDEGDIFLNNTSIITNKTYLYNNIGLCQQDDILFDYLTVEEHLTYMMELKGAEKDKNQIDTFIQRIDLENKRHSICKGLSGGEKRKLCIAIALIGNSQLVLLDEPTSGMDVISKRKLWNFLKEFKNDKIIILTTHSLDEAEYLGDRIGIMSSGQFICSGSSSYLKSKYPCGFNLNLLVNSEIFDLEKKRELFNELVKYEPNLSIKISSKAIFSINIESNNKNIKQIFEVIEKNRDKFGIEDYTVSSTTLEDVFLKLNHKININEDNNNDINNNALMVKDSEENNSNAATFFSQLLSHIKRGFFSIGRNASLFVLELLIGLFILYIYVLIQYNVLNQMSRVSLNLNDLLKHNYIYICKENEKLYTSSFAYKDIKSIKLKKIDQKNNINDFKEEIYKKALGHIGKAGLCFTDTRSGQYKVLLTEVPMEFPGYTFASMMFAVSAFLKKEYDINAEIFSEIADLPSNDVAGLGINISEMSSMFSLCFACIISLNLYLGSLVTDKIRERINNIKHILYISGSNIWSYWCGFYVVDLFKLLIFISFASVSLYLINSFASYIWISLIITSFSCLCFIYSISFFLEKEDSGQKTLNLITFALLIVFAIIIIIMSTTSVKVDLTFFLNKFNFTFFDITPVTAFLLSYLRLILSYTIFKAEIFKNDKEREIPGFGVIYRPKIYILTNLMTQSINLVFYIGVLILLESGILDKLFNKLKTKLMRENNITFSNPDPTKCIVYDGDEIPREDIISKNELDALPKRSIDIMIDNNKVNNNNIINNNLELVPNNNNNQYILNEINKINNDNKNELTVKLIGIKKTYWVCCNKNIRAINNLYLGLENNEKFGLLGFNGSGKSTTFKTITKEILYDSGSIHLFGKNTETQFNDIRNFIGYCPQENPIFDYMKVREIISFYLDLKNIKESTESVCERFGLTRFLDTYCINLSGGNKRKLSFAIALMCNPKLLLLDEPSTGVDPESRRIMWKNIMNLNKDGNQFNMILTTHSMEEAEVLCDTVSWLKSGNFLSIGNPEKLKIALSAGYKLNMKFVQLNQQIPDEVTYEKALNNASNNIKDFNKLINNIKALENIKPYIIEFEKVINLIKGNCLEISLIRINHDFSFEINLKIIKEKQSALFTQILDMKNTNHLLSEISISMESLENILTKL